MTVPITPPVPADLDLTKFPFMPLDVRRLRDSDLALESDPEVFKAAVLLWCASWHQVPASSLPNCDTKLAKLAGYGDNVRRFLKVKSAALRGFSLATDGRIYHEVVAEKASEAHSAKLKGAWTRDCARLKKAAQRAEQKPVLPTFDEWLRHFQATGNEHWNPPASPGTGGNLSPGTGSGQNEGRPEGTGSLNGQGNGEGQGQGLIGGTGATGGAPPPAESKSNRGTRLPPDWTIPKSWGFWALERGLPAERARIEAEKFKNHWTAKSGKDATKLDWEATWRNWVLRALDDLAKSGKGSPRAGDIAGVHDANRAAADELRRERPDLFDEDPPTGGEPPLEPDA